MSSRGLTRLTRSAVFTVVVTMVLALAANFGVVQSSAAATPAPNPPLASVEEQCADGLQIALVVDLSGSMVDTSLSQPLTTLKRAATSYVNAFAGTDTSIQIFTFASYSPANNAQNQDRPLTSVKDQQGVATLTSWINGWTADGATNWSAALRDVAAAPTTFDFVIFITDGEPNVDNDTMVDNANAVKAQGTRIYVVFVSDGGYTNERGAYIASISGEISGLPAKYGLEKNDYFTTDWSNMTTVIQSLASTSAKCTQSTTQDKTTTRTIHYMDEDGNPVLDADGNPMVEVQTVTYTESTNAATNAKTYSSTETYDEVTPPTIPGYSPDKATVPSVSPVVSPSVEPQPTEEYVTYTPNNQNVNVVYVDDDMGQSVVDPKDGTITEMSGKTGTAVGYTEDDAQAGVPEKYDYVKTEGIPEFYDNDDSADQTITVHLKHHISTSDEPVTTNRTIHFEGAGDDTPQDQTQPITWTVTTDDVTGVTTYTPDEPAYPAADVPVVPGYDTTDVIDPLPVAPTTERPGDETTTVTYVGNGQRVTIRYVDDTLNGKAVTPRAGTPNELIGTSGELIGFTQVDALTGVPSGYDYTSMDLDGTEWTPAISYYDTDVDHTQVITVHLVHHITLGDPLVTHRTIQYVDDGGNPMGDPVIQDVTWTVSTDEVTGETTYTTDDPGYGELPIDPKDHYTTSIEGTPADTVPAEDVPASTTEKPTDTDVTVTYSPVLTTEDVTVTRTIHYVDDSTSHNTMAPDSVQSVTYTKTTNTATGTVTYTAKDPNPGFDAVDSPEVPTWAPGTSTVDAVTLPAESSTLPASSELTVTYSQGLVTEEIPVTRTITYVDESDNPVADPLVQTVTYVKTTNTVTGDVTYAPKNPNPGFPAVDAKDIDHYNTPDPGTVDAQSLPTDDLPASTTVKLVYTPRITTEDVPVTRTIEYVGAGDKTPDPVTQTVTYVKTTNEVTGEVTYAPKDPGAEFPEQDSPDVTGYVPDSATVDALTVDPDPTDELPGIPTVTVTYSPKLTEKEVSVTRTITYVDEDGNPMPGVAPVTQSVTYIETTNEATGELTYAAKDPNPGFGSQDSPTIENYTPDKAIVQAELLPASPTTLPEDTIVPVTYTANGPEPSESPTAEPSQSPTTEPSESPTTEPSQSETPTQPTETPTSGPTQTPSETPTGSASPTTTPSPTSTPAAQKARVVYFDDVAGGYVPAANGATIIVSGPSGSAITVTSNDVAVGIPSGYAYKSMDVPAAFDSDDAVDQVITVHLGHTMTQSTLTTTRSVEYVGAGEDTPAPFTQTITWDVVTDDVTGDATYTTTSTSYPLVNTPPVEGYYPDLTSVPAVSVPASTTDKPQSQTVTVTYAPGQVVNVVYIDAVTGEEVTPAVGAVTMVTGPSGSDVNFTEANARAGVPTLAGYEFDSWEPVATFDEDANVDQTITVYLAHHMTEMDPVTTTRTIDYEGAGDNTPEDVPQEITWSVVRDDVTGETTYTPAEPQYDEVESPEIDGYTVDVDTVPAVPVEPTTTVPQSTTVPVTYTANEPEPSVSPSESTSPSSSVSPSISVSPAPSESVSPSQSVTSSPSSTTSPTPSQSPTQSLSPSQSPTQSLSPSQSPTQSQSSTGNPSPTQSASPTQSVTSSPAPSEQKANVVFIDDVTGEPVPGAGMATVTGPSGAQITITPEDVAPAIPAGYVYKGMDVPPALDSDDSVDQVITVHLDHHLTQSEMTTTRTIDYAGAGDATPADVVQSVTWTVVTDDVTGASTYTTTQSGYPSVATPSVEGFYPDTTLVPAQTVPASTTQKPASSTVPVAYAPGQTVNVVYVDDVTGEEITPAVGATTVLAGPSGSDVSFTEANARAGVPVQGGYEFSSWDPVATFDDDPSADQTIVVHCGHTVTSLPDVTTSRTIDYEGAGADTPQDVVQDVTWTVVRDEVTGVTTYTPDEPQYDEVSTPDVEGFTPDRDDVPSVPVEPMTTLPESTTVPVTYTANEPEPSESASPSVSVSPSQSTSPSPSVSQTPSQSASPTVSSSPSQSPTSGPSHSTSPSPSVSPTHSASPTQSPTSTQSSAPTQSPTPVAQKATVVFVDDMANGRVIDPKPGAKTQVTGAAGTPIAYTEVDALQGVPTGYQYVSMSVPAVFDSNGDADQVITVHVSHHVTTTQITTSRTVEFEGVGEDTPDPVVQDVTWTVATDDVTGATTYTPGSPDYPSVTIPDVPGYHPDSDEINSVPLTTTNTPPRSTTVTVTYAADQPAEPGLQKATVVYYDDEVGQIIPVVPGGLAEVTGLPGAPIIFTADDAQPGLPNGYMVETVEVPGNFDSDDVVDQTITVHLVHQTTVTEMTTTRTVIFTGAGSSTPDQIVQAIHWNVTTDLVTGAVTYTTTEGGYPELTAPIVTGYAPDPATVPALTVPASMTDKPVSTTVSVTYSQVTIAAKTGGVAETSNTLALMGVASALLMGGLVSTRKLTRIKH